MFCTRCGAQVSEDASFCEFCGVNLKADEIQEQEIKQSVYTENCKQRPLSTHPVLNTLKTLASSPLFLAAVIAYTVMVVARIITMTDGDNEILYYIREIAEAYRGLIPYAVYDLIEVLEYSLIGRMISFFAGFVTQIPSIVVCSGLWITYISARNRVCDGMKTAGLTMIKVVLIMNIFMCVIFFLIVAVLAVVAVVCLMEYLTYSEGITLMIYLTVLVSMVLAVEVLTVIYLIKAVKSINGVKDTINTGVFRKKVSVYVAVMNLILAFFTVFGIVSYAGNFIRIISVISEVTALITFTIAIFKYNDSMVELQFIPEQTEQ